MSANIISPNDASLVLHRLVTERLPVLVWFVSADRVVTVKISGFVASFDRGSGLVVRTEIAGPDSPGRIPVFLTIAHDAVASAQFRYSDESELPEDFELGSGLRIELPNGDNLTLAEIRSQTRP